MRFQACIFAGLLLVAAVALAQSKGQEKAHGDHMEHRFDNPEQLAKGFDDPARDAWKLPDRVLAALDLKQGQIVADIGSGTGYFTVRLAKLKTVSKVYAADVEPSMAAYVRKRAAAEGLTNVIALQATADTPNLPEPVDLVLIVNTIIISAIARYTSGNWRCRSSQAVVWPSSTSSRIRLKARRRSFASLRRSSKPKWRKRDTNWRGSTIFCRGNSF
jgi:SAM-dependent methyltransferase